MTAESAGRRELAQLVSDHILGNIHGDVAATIMNGNCVTNESRENCGSAAPGLKDLFLAGLIHIIDPNTKTGRACLPEKCLRIFNMKKRHGTVVFVVTGRKYSR